VSAATNNIDPDDLARRITPRTRAVIAVHLFGLCADIPAIRKILPPSVLLFEDCACAAGASLDGVPAGGLADAGVFSFHPRKSVTTGEGGMVTTNNSELAVIAGQLRNHGASISDEQLVRGPRPYLLADFNRLGFNYRMTDLQGAVGLVQLGKLDRFIAERQRWAEYYRDQLADIPWLRLPQFAGKGTHAWQAFVTYVDPETAPLSRNEIMERLQAQGIATRPGTHAVHMLGYYRDRFGFKPETYPGSRDCNDNTMAIPLHNRMTPDDYAYVARSLREL
jgi:perosamine synthetase